MEEALVQNNLKSKRVSLSVYTEGDHDHPLNLDNKHDIPLLDPHTYTHHTSLEQNFLDQALYILGHSQTAISHVPNRNESFHSETYIPLPEPKPAQQPTNSCPVTDEPRLRTDGECAQDENQVPKVC